MHRLIFFMLLLCSNPAMADPSKMLPAPVLPDEVAINKEAGHGQKLSLTLRMENGKELLLVVDTGSGGTILDRFLEPTLTNYNYLGVSKVNFTWWSKAISVSVYEAPKVYLGNTQLLLGDVIYTADLSQIIKRPLVGILGMDCLRHYCIQLDFAAGKIRFLDPNRVNEEKLGEKYPLTYSKSRLYSKGNPLIKASFFGQSKSYCVDTGCDDDAAFKPQLFQQKVRELGEKSALGTWLTATLTNYIGGTGHEGYFQKAMFNGQSFTNFILQDHPDENLVGLRFLARHLVTFDFPKNTMYLQRRGDEPFGDENLFAKNVEVFFLEAEEFLFNLKKKGEMPGWLKDDHGEVNSNTPDDDASRTYPISRSFIATKNHDVSRYHYLVSKASKDSNWKLQRAWRTDGSDHVMEEYPVP